MDQQSVQVIIETLKEEGIDLAVTLPEEAIRTVLSLSDNPKAASANPKDFYDNSLLKELEDSGFVKELYSR